MIRRDEAVTRLSETGAEPIARAIAVEAPVAVEFNGIGYAVMMMTPADLPAFALGFALTERIAAGPDDVIDCDVADVPAGIVLRITVSPSAAERIGERIRHRTSDTGCGLCGIASLDSLQRPLPPAPKPMAIDRAAIDRATAGLREYQPLGAATGATHAAAFCGTEGAIIAAAEDVGRHNALDKLIGGIGGKAPGPGFALVTSRISFEMADKALVAGFPLLVGISAATTMALDHARRNGLALVALARRDSMLVMNDPAIGTI
ncbi:formate dehydrogenase accessory sulfurtransferase FdhD [Stakelama sp. CBK3Z-3]|uniref:Sulfur carrier protein FdhD n=1 Tax=Stakelama flava TaxID=2860338 RepID=A0ABS6XI18_9SPHN|nr:formate dehydrogenase accessory sulfurtransferase FdhD [Stakelama flava]MBW4329539.1 formate dehydrogenase accessory sulfurtransferase FdhD [Stakelama flava]